MFDIWESGKVTKADKPENVRMSKGCVTYKVNMFGMNGPRKMHVYLPEVIGYKKKDFYTVRDEKDVKHILLSGLL